MKNPVNKVNLRQVLVFRLNAETYKSRNPGETRLNNILSRVLDKTLPIAKDWAKKLEDLQIDHASEDLDGNLMYTLNGNDKLYKMTREKTKEYNKAVETELDRTDIPVEKFTIAMPAKRPHESYIEVFSPFIVFVEDDGSQIDTK